MNSHRSAVGTPDAKPADDLRAALDALQADVIAIERSVAEASYFLPAYDSRACTAAVDHLKKTVADATAELLPRKVHLLQEEEGGDRFENRTARRRRRTTSPRSSRALGYVRRRRVTTRGTRNGPKGSKRGRGTRVRNRRRDRRGRRGVGCGWQSSSVSWTARYLCNLEPLRAVRAYDLRNTRVYAARRGQRAAARRGRCEFHLCARQVRIHDATNGTRFTSGRHPPIIEHSSDVRFAPTRSGTRHRRGHGEGGVRGADPVRERG